MHKPDSRDLNKIYELIPKADVLDTGFSRVTVKGWFSLYDALVEVTDEYALLSAGKGDKRINISPLAVSDAAYMKAVAEYERLGLDSISGADKRRADILESLGYEVTADENMFEYLYSPEDLIELKGPKYHAKRNFINRFSEKYVFRPYRESDYEALMELVCMWSYRHIDNGVRFCEQEGWIKYKSLDKVEVDDEIIVLDRVVRNLKEFNCFADVMEIDGKVAAFAAGEILPSNVGALYFEKANIDYRGIYPVLDNLFCREHFASVRYINKQEDMGLEGLRKSKQSYHPVRMAERYTAVKR